MVKLKKHVSSLRLMTPMGDIWDNDGGVPSMMELVPLNLLNRFGAIMLFYL